MPKKYNKISKVCLSEILAGNKIYNKGYKEVVSMEKYVSSRNSTLYKVTFKKGITCTYREFSKVSKLIERCDYANKISKDIVKLRLPIYKKNLEAYKKYGGWICDCGSINIRNNFRIVYKTYYGTQVINGKLYNRKWNYKYKIPLCHLCDKQGGDN
jgi:hypothetical protein